MRFLVTDELCGNKTHNHDQNGRYYYVCDICGYPLQHYYHSFCVSYYQRFAYFFAGRNSM